MNPVICATLSIKQLYNESIWITVVAIFFANVCTRVIVYEFKEHFQVYKWIQHVCRLCSFKPQWLSTMGPIRFSHSTKAIPFRRICMNSMNSIGKIKRMKGAKRNKSNKYYRVDTDFFLYVLCYLHPFYPFIFLFMQSLSLPSLRHSS